MLLWSVVQNSFLHQIPAFSSSVEIRYEAGRGRFGVATRDIPVGELVCVETPPVFFLHEETSGVRIVTNSAGQMFTVLSR